MTDDDITQWIAATGDGDEAAAQAIWDKYFERLLRYAKRNLGGMPHRAVDEEDVVLSAMNSFFAGARNGKLEPKDRDELWKLLATITVRKATAHLRRHYAAKRGGGNVRGESAFIDGANSDDARMGINQVLDDRRLPEMSGCLVETCEERLASLEDDTLRKIAILKLEGYGTNEIAEKLACSRATVKRKLTRIREKWSQQDADIEPRD